MVATNVISNEAVSHPGERTGRAGPPDTLPRHVHVINRDQLSVPKFRNGPGNSCDNNGMMMTLVIRIHARKTPSGPADERRAAH